MAAKKKAKKAAPKKKVAKKASPKKAAKKVAKKAAAKKAAPKKAAKKAAPKKKAARKAPKAPAPAAPAEAPAAEAAAEGEGSGDSEPPRGRSSEAGGSSAPKAGDPAPYFEMAADDGSLVKLSDLRGRKVVLYFYPRDNTPGCTIEAKDFSRLQREFEANNAVVLGVSTDTLDSHRKFKGKCELSVKLLTDPDMLVHQSYGAWGEKNMYGRKMMGTIRSTFLIDEDGRLKKVWPKVKVADHALEVLNSL